ncbi:MAG: phospholipid/cholesterol/gamma-HCH transport system substrate-binding protein [Pseudonocardiales bacterium]|nr:phospholipid/cholesterol/gamma-HCH transport system substrate-binding protein [Pseudonocardiales bacterium]
MKRLSLRGRSSTVGLVAVALFALFMVALFEKPAILTFLKPGVSVVAEFSRQYKLEAYRSPVKLAGTPVGVVTGVEPTDHGTVAVSLKLDSATLWKIGKSPSAEIRPTTVLGGNYYVALKPGGEPGKFTDQVIPAERTRIPVELDTLLRAIPPQAQQSMQHTTAHLDDTLKAGAGDALRDLAREAPAALAPTGAVIDAARGTRPGTDLAQLVTDLNRTAQVLTHRDGQLGDIVDAVASTSNTLADRSGPLAEAVAALPETLRLTRTGAQDLTGTLDRLTTTAESIRPAVRQLDPLMQQLDPTLAAARPLVSDLRPLLEQARPVVEELVPATQQATTVLDDVRGPVLDRVNGPIINTIMSEWHGQAPKYPEGGNGNKFYEELGYLFTNMNNASQFYDQNGGLVRIQAGAGTSSLVNTPGGLDQLLVRLGELGGPPPPGNGPLLKQGLTGGPSR